MQKNYLDALPLEKETQVRNRQKQWVDVKPIPDSFVVNIGDLMMQWTNERWISTVHRVVNPSRDRTKESRRQSLVFFHQRNYDAISECLESCYNPNDPPKYAPISSGAFERAFLSKP